MLNKYTSRIDCSKQPDWSSSILHITKEIDCFLFLRVLIRMSRVERDRGTAHGKGSLIFVLCTCLLRLFAEEKQKRLEIIVQQLLSLIENEVPFYPTVQGNHGDKPGREKRPKMPEREKERAKSNPWAFFLFSLARSRALCCRRRRCRRSPYLFSPMHLSVLSKTQWSSCCYCHISFSSFRHVLNMPFFLLTLSLSVSLYIFSSSSSWGFFFLAEQQVKRTVVDVLTCLVVISIIIVLHRQ